MENRQEKTPVGPMLRAALAYAKPGWPVLPLHGIESGRCTCGKATCASPGKHPDSRLVPHGLKDASTDDAVVRAWWRKHPTANVGIVTGAKSGLVVLDVDPRNGGDETLRRLIDQHGPLPAAVEAQTGGGGRHVYFRHPGGAVKCQHGRLGPGLDVKGDGGYVVAPPSMHIQGRSYEWAEGRSPSSDTPLAELPPWARPSTAKRTSGLAGSKASHFAEGERNDRLASLAGLLRQNGMEEEGILDTLSKVNADQCNPPLADAEVRAIAKSIAKYPPGEQTKDSQATRLVALAADVEFFHDRADDAYAVLPVGAHRECWPVDSKAFRGWLRGLYWKAKRTAPGSQAVHDAVGVLTSKAIYDGPQNRVSVRIAGNDTTLFVDLGDQQWRAVRVTAEGWAVEDTHPVRFIRPRGMRPLPEPVRGGRLADLREYLNVGSEGDWALVAAWLVAAFRPSGPYPLLVVTGEQGSAKSSLCRVLQAMVDPRQPALRSQPRNEHDLMISAANSWVLSFDNLSQIPSSLSDALCRLATSGGLSTRELYTNGDEKLFEAVRPILVNGIEDLASRSDLLDRSVCLSLPPIRSSRRQTEAEFWDAFERARPAVLGGLLDAVATAIRRLPAVRIEELPRMADFAKWAVAAEPALGVRTGAVLEAYRANRENMTAFAIETSAVGPAITELVKKLGRWEGTAKDLLAKLNRSGFVDPETQRRRDWPRTPRGMAGALKRLAPDLRQAGIDVERLGKTGKAGTRLVVLSNRTARPPASPAPPAGKTSLDSHARVVA